MWECIWSEIDEQIVYNQLDGNEKAVWSLYSQADI